MNEENQAIIKALNMYGRVPEQWELLNEIERQKEIIRQLDIKNLELITTLKEVREYCINRSQFFNEARIEQYTFSREEEYSIENILEILDKVSNNEDN